MNYKNQYPDTFAGPFRAGYCYTHLVIEQARRQSLCLSAPDPRAAADAATVANLKTELHLPC